MITQYSPEEAQAAGAQARESGVWLNCHAQAPESIKLAVRNGFRSIYHCTYADAEAIDLLEEHKESIFLSLPSASCGPTCTRAPSTVSTPRWRRRWGR